MSVETDLIPNGRAQFLGAVVGAALGLVIHGLQVGLPDSNDQAGAFALYVIGASLLGAIVFSVVQAIRDKAI